MAIDDVDLQTIDNRISRIVSTSIATMRKALEDKIEALDVPDTRNLVTKKLVNDIVEDLKKGINEEITKLQEAVKKIAEETDTKIKALTPPKDKPWYATLLD